MHYKICKVNSFLFSLENHANVNKNIPYERYNIEGMSE